MEYYDNYPKSGAFPMEEESAVLEYNTEREPLKMPEYGRNVVKMVRLLRRIPDRNKRSQQAAAIVRVMRSLNPQVANEENWEQKLWDHLHMIAGYELDVDCPYPVPKPEQRETLPLQIPMKKAPIKATHYGRNIESIIELIAGEPDGDMKTSMIRQLAIYMRQQYLIWNKDSVADSTIFQDIEKLSGYRIRVPEGISLTKIASDANFSRPGLNLDFGNNNNNRNKQVKRNNYGKKNNSKGR